MKMSHNSNLLIYPEKHIYKATTLTKNPSKLQTPLVAIASNIKDNNLLAAGIQPGINTVILDENRDAIEQITTALTNHSASSLHIICHGSPGVLYFGKKSLNLENIHQYRHFLAEWNVTNILLWSCHVAAENRHFLTTLHQLTGANIAASCDFVGNYETYSNWQLDYHIGTVAEPSVFTPALLESYSGLFTDPGNDFDTAQDIGVLGSTQTFSEAVGTTDRQDWYKFTLNEISTVNLNLEGLTDPANISIVTILNNSETVIEFDNISDFSHSTEERVISKTLSPGTYAIRVYTADFDDNTGYTLTASATVQASTNGSDPGEDFDSALNLGSLSGTQTFTDAVGSLDRSDYYQFTLNEISTVSLNLEGLTDPANISIVTILNNLETVIEFDNISDFSHSTEERVISKTLSPGTYAIRVYTADFDDNTSYTLTASGPDLDEIDYASRPLTINGVTVTI